jgi:NAD(P)-dependent dehydrogenase (short-subunit alcohol dehydrogenase family)
MKKLTGKVAVITGGNSGLGYASAKELIENGAKVIITGRRKEAVEKAAAGLGATGLIADQTKLADIERLAGEVSKQYGKIDILMINAGATKLTSIEAATEEVYDEMMNLNLRGAYFTLSRFIPVLNDGASVIFISSSSASKCTPHTSIYMSGKAAINAVVKVAALELAPRGIRVNAISPGPFATEIMEKSGIADKDTQAYIVSQVPLGRLGAPSEVGKMVSFLASDDAAYITGTEYLIDGGQSLNK